MKNKDLFVNSVLRADLLLSDYALTTDAKEKEAFLEILSDYIYSIDNSKTTLIYQKLCDSHGSEKEIYTEILMDLLAKLKTNVLEDLSKISSRELSVITENNLPPTSDPTALKIFKAINSITDKIPSKYDLSAKEINTLTNNCNESFYLIVNSFKYGFVKGSRYIKSQNKSNIRV